jgi:AraC-like DNA-binding protein
MSVIPLFPAGSRDNGSSGYRGTPRGHRYTGSGVAIARIEPSSLSSCTHDCDLDDLPDGSCAIEREPGFSRVAISTSIWSARRDGSTAFVDGQEIRLSHSFTNQVTWFERIHPDDLPRTLARWSVALRTGQPFHDIHRETLQNGNYERVLVNGIAIRDENGGVVCWIGVKTATGDPDVECEKLQSGELILIGSSRRDPTADETRRSDLSVSRQLLAPQTDHDDLLADAAPCSPPSIEPTVIERSLLETVSAAVNAALSASSQCLDPKLLRDSRIKALLRDLSSADRIPPELAGLYSHFLCVAILTRIGGGQAIGRAYVARRRIAPLPKWRLARVVQYIGDHIEESIRLADLAKAAGLTRMHFAAQFRATVGVGPHEYLLRRRIERAQMLLQDPKQRLVDVALSVGFQAQPHFTTVFRRFVGVSPHRWRLSQDVSSSGDRMRTRAAAAVGLPRSEGVRPPLLEDRYIAGGEYASRGAASYSIKRHAEIEKTS